MTTCSGIFVNSDMTSLYTVTILSYPELALRAGHLNVLMQYLEAVHSILASVRKMGHTQRHKHTSCMSSNNGPQIVHQITLVAAMPVSIPVVEIHKLLYGRFLQSEILFS